MELRINNLTALGVLLLLAIWWDRRRQKAPSLDAPNVLQLRGK